MTDRKNVGGATRRRVRAGRRTRFISQIAVAVLALTACVVATSAGSSGAATVQGLSPNTPPQPGHTIICDHNEHVPVHDPQGVYYQVRNPYWYGQQEMCLRNEKDFTNFKVVQHPGYNKGGRVVAYPDIFRGCIWNICSPDAGIPVKISHIRHLSSTWHTQLNSRGTWNASYDIWIGEHKQTTGQNDGAELMIWLNTHGACCALSHNARKVKIGAHQYVFSNWTASNPKYPGISWNYLQLRLYHHTNHVNNLRLKPIIHWMARHGLVKHNWWVNDVSAGFETWTGGRGLATTKYRVYVKSGKRGQSAG